MPALALHAYFGRALAISAGVHALVAALVMLRPMWQNSTPWQLPDSVDVGIVTVGDVAALGGGVAAAGPKQVAQVAAPEPAAKAPEPAQAPEPEPVEMAQEPDSVPVAPLPPKAPAKPKSNPKPVKADTPKKPVVKQSAKATGAPGKSNTSAAVAERGAIDGGSTPSASSALSSIMAKYQKPGGKGDGEGLGDQRGGRDGVAASGIASNFYHRTLVARIRQFWNVPPGVESDGLATVFALVIGRDGALQAVNLVKSSGDRLFDASAEKAVHAAAPYSPVPQSIEAPLRVEVRLIPENKN